MPGVTGKLIVDAVLEAHPWAQRGVAAGARRRARCGCGAVLRPGDLCLTLGAGDLTGAGADRILALLEARR